MANDQVSLPTLIVVLVVVGLATRYLFFSGSASSSSSSGGAQARSGRAARHAGREANLIRMREEAVHRIQQMFPQVDRRTILWDLQRNGGNIQMTSERILSGRLEMPPITFQPPPPPEGSTPANPSGSAAQARQPEKPSQPDLITRYNLEEKLGTTSEGTASGLDGDGAAGSSKSVKKGWSTDKQERQSLLQRRRDEMILAARRKMEAKIAAEKTAGGSAS